MNYASSLKLRSTLYSVFFSRLGTFIDFEFESLLHGGALSNKSCRNVPFGPFFAC